MTEWKLVPIPCDEEMERAAENTFRGLALNGLRHVINAANAAAPSPWKPIDEEAKQLDRVDLWFDSELWSNCKWLKTRTCWVHVSTGIILCNDDGGPTHYMPADAIPGPEIEE